MWKGIKALFGMGEKADPPEVVEAKRRMAIDAAEPRKRYVWCVLAISTSERVDPGYLPEFASKAIREWYGMKSREKLLENIAYYIGGTGSTPGYDAFRAAFMARAGFGAGMLSEDESWDAAFRVVRNLKRSYPSWDHYANGYLDGHLAFRKKQGDSDDALQRYRRNILERQRIIASTVWPQTPYEMPV
ncbi:MAG TPA: DUF1266 domain-containing protein [Polyangiaceae bacterium]|nr:DUF1266 domain-containing protein [Polyangiaceae bacterium]